MKKKTVSTQKSVSTAGSKKSAAKARAVKKAPLIPAKQKKTAPVPANQKKAVSKHAPKIGKPVSKTAQSKTPKQVVRPAAAKRSPGTKGIIVEKPVIAVASVVSPIVRKSVKAPERVVNPKKVAAENKKRFAKDDLKDFRISLHHKREQLMGLAVNMRKDALERHDEENIEEDGTDSFSRLQTLGQAESQSQQIKAIDEALRAIDGGLYGVCADCGNLISKLRLLALPFATSCIGCAQAKETLRKKRFF